MSGGSVGNRANGGYVRTGFSEKWSAVHVCVEDPWVLSITTNIDFYSREGSPQLYRTCCNCRAVARLGDAIDLTEMLQV